MLVSSEPKARALHATDSTPSADAPAGRHRMAGLEIELRDGAARAPHGTLAGSALTLNRAVFNWAGLRAAADLIVVDGEGLVQRVLHRGAWLT
jgi:N-acetylglucosamine-6-phosphate deacetylase